MGASRKLQTEIDRVLKKVNEGVQEFDAIWDKVYETDNANLKEKFEGDLKKEIKKLQRYRDQIKTWQQSSEIKDKKALMDARKIIEREMERFKVCEKEMKTKAFSKEGLGQQPKTDPKEKAKSETRDWLNNVVADLESQIDNFEAELEGISGKKGKTRNPQLTRLEASIGRHKAHVMKLELILRLLDNDELYPDQVNDLKYYLDDYLECNQVDFDRFSNIDELYVSLPLDKVEAMEDMVALGTSGLVKAALLSTNQQTSDQDQSDETTSQDINSDVIPKTAHVKTGLMEPLVSSCASPALDSATPEVPSSPVNLSASVSTLSSAPRTAAPSSLAAASAITEEPAASMSSLADASSSAKAEASDSFPDRKPSPVIPENGLERGISREAVNQGPLSSPMGASSVRGISSTGALASVPLLSDLSKRNISSVDERIEGGYPPPSLASPLSSRMLSQQVSKVNDGTVSNDNVSDGTGVVGRTFSHALANSQWRSQSAVAFQNQNEIHGRPEFAPDHREKYLQRLQQVKQSPGALLSAPHLLGPNSKQFPLQQEHSVLQQNSIQQLAFQNLLNSNGQKDTEVSNSKDELQQQQNLSDDMNPESNQNSGISNIKSDDNLRTLPMVTGATTEMSNLQRDGDSLSGQQLQASHSSTSVGVIGRRSVSDLGAVGDNLAGSTINSSVTNDQLHNLQLLEAALLRLPQPSDSDRLKRYIPRKPAATPASYPQVQADIVRNPDFWKRLGFDQMGIDTLFFAFYFQQNTYQQYLAARELKRQSWRYHKQYNTWFQRHVEPEIATDDYEKGTYVYFDFHLPDGWCQRVKGDFAFDYKHLEDELVV